MKKQNLGIEWFMPGRKRAFMTTTKATSDLIEIVAEQIPDITVVETIGQVHFDGDAKSVLFAYRDAGYGGVKLSDLLANKITPVRSR